MANPRLRKRSDRSLGPQESAKCASKRYIHIGHEYPHAFFSTEPSSRQSKGSLVCHGSKQKQAGKPKSSSLLCFRRLFASVRLPYFLSSSAAFWRASAAAFFKESPAAVATSSAAFAAASAAACAFTPSSAAALTAVESFADSDSLVALPPHDANDMATKAIAINTNFFICFYLKTNNMFF